MICLPTLAMMYFLAVTGLQAEANAPLLLVHSDSPLVYVWRNGMFCTGGAAL